MLSDEQIDMIRCHSQIPQATDREYLQLTRADMRVFARAIEAEVSKDYDALIRQMLEALTAPVDGEALHALHMSAIAAARASLEKSP
jgi:hypothetical protein